MLGLGVSAEAGLVINLRFADGAVSKEFAAADVGRTLTVNVWGKVTGADANLINDGFPAVGSAGYRVLSAATGTGVTPTITASATSANFTSNGSLNGSIQDLNGDGIKDIGGSALASAAIDTIAAGGTDIKARTSVALFNVDGTTEWLLSTFDVNIVAISGSASAGNNMTYSLLVPSHQSLAANRPAAWYQDGINQTTLGTSGTSPTNYSTGTSVEFIQAVPEPATLTVLSLGLLALGGRRRRRPC